MLELKYLYVSLCFLLKLHFFPPWFHAWKIISVKLYWLYFLPKLTKAHAFQYDALYRVGVRFMFNLKAREMQYICFWYREEKDVVENNKSWIFSPDSVATCTRLKKHLFILLFLNIQHSFHVVAWKEVEAFGEKVISVRQENGIKNVWT